MSTQLMHPYDLSDRPQSTNQHTCTSVRTINASLRYEWQATVGHTEIWVTGHSQPISIHVEVSEQLMHHQDLSDRPRVVNQHKPVPPPPPPPPPPTYAQGPQINKPNKQAAVTSKLPSPGVAVPSEGGKTASPAAWDTWPFSPPPSPSLGELLPSLLSVSALPSFEPWGYEWTKE